MVKNQYNPIEELEIDKSDQGLANLFKEMIQEKTGVDKYKYKGENLYADYAPVEGTNWILTITASTD